MHNDYISLFFFDINSSYIPFMKMQAKGAICCVEITDMKEEYSRCESLVQQEYFTNHNPVKRRAARKQPSLDHIDLSIQAS